MIAFVLLLPDCGSGQTSYEILFLRYFSYTKCLIIGICPSHRSRILNIWKKKYEVEFLTFELKSMKIYNNYFLSMKYLEYEHVVRCEKVVSQWR